MFSKEILKIVDGLKYYIDGIGRSNDKIYVFENKYILKVSTDSNSLLREKEKTDWLADKISGSKSILFIEEKNIGYYLRTCINGDSLISERFIKNPRLLIGVLKNVKEVLRSLDDKNCPFKSGDNIGLSFVHGDLCLPNIYVDNNNHFIGFIDLENAGLGDEYYDYSWLLWSFEYNLGTNIYNKMLLSELDIEIDMNKYNKYVLENK